MTHDQTVIALGVLIYLLVGLAVVHLVGGPKELMESLCEEEPEFDAIAVTTPQAASFAVAVVHGLYVALWPVVLALAIYCLAEYCWHCLRRHPFRGCAEGDPCFHDDGCECPSAKA
ncbi:hypothetical protein N7U49_21370 [Streptomyces sp. AD2-2]|nr:hypothetical protein N7U49_21370 [Streptomyces sp. AD2-2]